MKISNILHILCPIILLVSCSSSEKEIEDRDTNIKNSISENTTLKNSIRDSSPSDNSNTTNYNKEQSDSYITQKKIAQGYCAIKTFGPSICEKAVNLSRSIELPSYMLSPGCTVAVNELFSEDTSLSDIVEASIYGAVNDMADNIFGGDNFIDKYFKYGLKFGLQIQSFASYNTCVKNYLEIH